MKAYQRLPRGARAARHRRRASSRRPTTGTRIVAVEAVLAGKDLHVQKPLTYDIDEAIALRTAVRAKKRILQTGSQQRSSKPWNTFRVATEAVRNGRIGQVQHRADRHRPGPAEGRGAEGRSPCRRPSTTRRGSARRRSSPTWKTGCTRRTAYGRPGLDHDRGLRPRHDHQLGRAPRGHRAVGARAWSWAGRLALEGRATFMTERRVDGAPHLPRRDALPGRRARDPRQRVPERHPVRGHRRLGVLRARRGAGDEQRPGRGAAGRAGAEVARREQPRRS